MFYLTTHSTHFIYGNMASDIWLRTILIVRKEGFFYMHHPTDRIAHTTAFVTPVVEHWLLKTDGLTESLMASPSSWRVGEHIPTKVICYSVTQTKTGSITIHSLSIKPQQLFSFKYSHY